MSTNYTTYHLLKLLHLLILTAQSVSHVIPELIKSASNISSHHDWPEKTSDGGGAKCRLFS